MKRKFAAKKVLLGLAAALLVLALLALVLLQFAIRYNYATHTPIAFAGGTARYAGEAASAAGGTDPAGRTIATRFTTPAGFARQPGSDYAEYIRNLPLLPDGSPVLLYNGTPRGTQDVHGAVLDVDVGEQDLQQCADAALRLRCEYLYASGQGDAINFHLTNGMAFPYAKYRDGYRLLAYGEYSVLLKLAGANDSYEVFSEYMDRLFTYAGSLSLSRECTPVADQDMQVGDIFVRGGTPGHVVMVADMCENDRGEKMFLLLQGYTPAQQIHILVNPATGGVWYSLAQLRYPFATPQYTFPEHSLMRMP